MRAVILMGSCGLLLAAAGCKGSGTSTEPTASATPTTPTSTPTSTPTETSSAPSALPDAGVACASKESRVLAKRNPKDNPRTRAGNPRIVGGRNSSLPWVVAVTTDGTHNSQYCGGSLIDKQWVLTAAHCKVQKNDKLIVGRTDLKLTNGNVVGIVEVKNHAGFDEDTQDNDIAVLKLAEPVDVETVDVYSGSANLADAVATVAGWGFVKEGGPASTKLLEVDVPVVTNAKCSAGYASDNVSITENMLCAGLARGGKDSCQGDSGGPMVVRGAGNKWRQAGVVSFGVGCARPDKYGVYARVSKYVDWIQACTK